MRATVLLLFTLSPGTIAGQAPPSAGLWRVAAASLTAPAALVDGATAPFWNPAAASPANLGAGVQILETSEVLGLRGLLAAVTKSLGRHAQVGLVFGRMDVRDLVRTTTSPNSVGGSIPVYDQMVGGRVRATLTGVDVGALVRVHDARFDVVRESGFTLDLGVRVAPTSRLVLAAATHFLPADLSERANTDYYAGAEYLLTRGIRIADLPTRVSGRYGASIRASGDVEHTLGVAATFADHVRIEGAVVRELAFGDAAWRPGFGLDVHIGRYAITFARALGINDVGGTYRFGVDVAFIR